MVSCFARPVVYKNYNIRSIRGVTVMTFGIVLRLKKKSVVGISITMVQTKPCYFMRIFNIDIKRCRGYALHGTNQTAL